jgi:hypothetical protein
MPPKRKGPSESSIATSSLTAPTPSSSSVPPSSVSDPPQQKILSSQGEGSHYVVSLLSLSHHLVLDLPKVHAGGYKVHAFWKFSEIFLVMLDFLLQVEYAASNRSGCKVC